MMRMILKVKCTGGINKRLMDYRRLVDRVDRMVHRIRRKYSVHIACHKGCACGCRNLSIWPIEALSLSGALQDLPLPVIATIRKRAAAASFWDCPLLQEGACSLYAFRPIICRTHGYPLLTHYQGEPSIGYCRHNFKSISSIPADAIIDLDKINGTLRAINASAVGEPGRVLQLPDRLSISEAILLEPE
jgi:Fe-S-cluster containining protein